MKKTFVILSALIIASAAFLPFAWSEGGTSAAEEVAALAAEGEVVAILQIDSVQDLKSLLASQPMLNGDFVKGLLDQYGAMPQAQIGEMAKELGLEGKAIMDAIGGIKSMALCLMDIKLGSHGAPEKVKFALAVECNVDALVPILKKLPFIAGTETIAGVEIMKIGGSPIPAGIAVRGGMLVIGDLSTLKNAFEGKIAKPFSATAEFKDAAARMKDRAVGLYVSGPALRDIFLGMMRSRQKKQFDAIWTLFGFEDLKYAVLTDDLSKKGTEAFVSVKKDGKFWNFYDINDTPPEALTLVPKNAPFYGTLNLGKFEVMLDKFAKMAAENMESELGKVADLKHLHRDLTEPKRELAKFKEYHFRDFAWFSLDMKTPPKVVLRFESQEHAVKFLQGFLEFTDGMSEDRWGYSKIDKTVKVEDYKDGKIYSFTKYDRYYKRMDPESGEKVWKISERTPGYKPKLAFAALKGNMVAVAYGHDDKVVRLCLDAAAGENAYAGLKPSTAIAAVNLKNLFGEVNEKFWSRRMPKPQKLFSDWTTTVTARRTEAGVELSSNASVIVNIALAAVYGPNVERAHRLYEYDKENTKEEKKEEKEKPVMR